MYYSSQDLKKIDDFQKYARFICDQFDVEVELEASKAQTDGRVIKLPNIIGMSDEEIDMMYAILLHETGHIKFSTFTPEAFAKLKTKNHAFLANCIEDARIENLLLKEFAGATEMLERFYCKNIVNRKLMKKVFNIPGKRPNLFNCLGLFLHGRLLNCRTAAFSRIATRTNYVKIRDFVKKYNLKPLLKTYQLRDWESVLSLTNKIYDLFVQEFGDLSEELDLGGDIIIKAQAEETLEGLQQEIIKSQIMTAPLQKKYAELWQDLDKWEKDHQKDFDDLFDEQRGIQEAVSDFNTALKNRRQKVFFEEQIQKVQNKINEFKTKVTGLKEDMLTIKGQIGSKTNGKGRPMTEKQMEAAKKSLATKTNQKATIEQKVKNLQTDISNVREKIRELKELKEEAHTKKLSDEAIQEKIAELQSKLSQSEAKQNILESERFEKSMELNEVGNTITQEIDRVQNKILDTVFDLENEAAKHDLPLDVLPQFQETPAWPQADEVQQEFDEQASKARKEIIRNGGRMAGRLGSSLEDLAVYIDNALERVKEIDLVEIFSDKAGFSRLPQFNQPEAVVSNYTDDQSTINALGSLYRHTVLTTTYDGIKLKNMGKNRAEITQLLTQEQNFIRSLKRVFQLKFKFSKRDYFRGGQEEGALDARNIWKLPTRQGEDYFEVNQPKMNNKIAASILVDISGSQDKANTEGGKKLKATALALSEAMKSVHIHHEILGYHAPICEEMKAEGASHSYNRRMNRLETVVYKNFTQNDNFGLSNLELDLTDNSDGESVRVALQRLKRERAKSKMLFILTDGKPFLSGADISILDEDLKAALRDAVKQKVQVFAIGFAPHAQGFYGERFCHAVEYTDIVRFCQQIPV